MRRNEGYNIIGEKWEYTLLADNYFDKNRDPKPASLIWHGVDFPPIAYEISPQVTADDISGPWWLPLLLWNGEVFDSNVFCYSVFLGLVPVVSILALDQEFEAETVSIRTIYVPHYSENCENAASHKNRLRSLMRNLVTHSNTQEADKYYSEVIDGLQKMRGTGEYETKFKLALLRFPYRAWIEGSFRLYTHPVVFYYPNQKK